MNEMTEFLHEYKGYIAAFVFAITAIRFVVLFGKAKRTELIRRSELFDVLLGFLFFVLLLFGEFLRANGCIAG